MKDPILKNVNKKNTLELNELVNNFTIEETKSCIILCAMLMNEFDVLQAIEFLKNVKAGNHEANLMIRNEKLKKNEKV
jgi:hypothetical protein